MLKRIARKVASVLDARDYDRWQRHQAERALRSMREHNGVELAPALRRLANAYATEVLGSRRYAPWLHVYAAVQRRFVEGWLPDNYFGRVIVPKVNNGLRITSLKTATNLILDTPALPDVAYMIDGALYDRRMQRIDLATLRASLDAEVSTVFVKSDASSRGQGVRPLAVSALTEEALRACGNCVVQLPIQQHPFFDEIIPGTLATIRVTTVKELDGIVRRRAAYLRVGRTNTQWVQSDNSVRIAVTSGEGDLGDVGYTEDWRQWSAHPDSGFIFSGTRMPGFADASALCSSLHQQVPHFGIVGWDVAVNRAGEAQIIEWNGGHCDIKFSEATTGPCFTGLNWSRFQHA